VTVGAELDGWSGDFSEHAATRLSIRSTASPRHIHCAKMPSCRGLAVLSFRAEEAR
jgi:hypothetical protein